MNMLSKNIYKLLFSFLLCLASTFFTINVKAQVEPPAKPLSCEKAISKDYVFTILESMLVQVGLYLIHDEYQDSTMPIAKDKTNLIDGKVEVTTKKWLAEYCNTLNPEEQADVLQQLTLSSAFVKLASQYAALKNLSENIKQIQRDPASATAVINALNSSLSTLQSPKTSVIGDYFKLTKISENEKELEPFKSLLDKNYPTISVFDSYARKADTDSSNSNLPFPTLADRAKQFFSQVPPPATEFTADCNCVEELYFETRNYQIFSATQLQPVSPQEGEEGAEKELGNPIKIDYSNTSRIAYDGIKIDDKNNIILNGWKEIDSSFIHQAHRHYSEVDLLVDIENWATSNQQDSEVQIEKIDALVFSDYSASIWETFYSNKAALDGVTLTFRDLYPQQPSKLSLEQQALAAAENINRYIKAGLQKYRDSINKLDISILLDLASCLGVDECADEYATVLYQKLDICPWHTNVAGSIERCSATDTSVKFILVTMPADFSHGNQRLENVLNSAYEGATRGQVFIKTLPIIQPYLLINDGDSPLLDASYFGKDMFGGNAYWPMPLESDKNYQTVANVIQRTTGAPENEPFAKLLVKFAENFVPFDICKLVCTERIWFRTIFVSYFALLLMLAFAKQEYCVLCSLIESYHKTYVTMWVVLFVSFIAWLGCDELWKNKQEEALLFTLGAIVLCLAIQSFSRSRKYVP